MGKPHRNRLHLSMISKNPHFLSGREKFLAKDFTGAVKDYSLALQTEENPSIYSERAVAYFHLQQLENSMEDMDYAVGLEPENPYRYSSRAYIKDAMGDTLGAIEDYEKAIVLDPEDAISLNNLGLLQEKLGYKEQAKMHFEKADRIAKVEKLFEEMQASGVLEEQDEPMTGREEQIHRLGFWQLMKHTFSTRSGWTEYWNFIKNGFR